MIQSLSYKLLFLMSSLMMCVGSYGQSSDMNYIQTKTFLDDAGTTFLRHIDYYDELGVVMETVDVGLNTSNTPIFTKTEYTPYLKPARQWAPIPASGLDYIANYYTSDTYGDSYAYTLNEYDDFQELTMTQKPGDSWDEHPATVERNVVSEGDVKKYYVDSNGNLCIDSNEAGRYYPYGVLTSIKTTDEDGRSITVYSNLHGETILERRGEDNDTYYVYDSYGRLSYVLPPMCQHCDDTDLPKYWYKYDYDDRGRCTAKQLPGCETVNYWYDNANRIQSEQDGELRSHGLYRNYRYDALGRMTQQVVHYVCGTATETFATVVEAKNYYDDYSFRTSFAQVFPAWADSINAMPASATSKGRPTATLRSTSDGGHYCEIYRYDNHGRLMCTLSAYDDKWMKTKYASYNFIGDVLDKEENVYVCVTNQYVSNQISLMTSRSTRDRYHSSTRLLRKRMLIQGSSGQFVSNPTYDVFGNVVHNERPGTAADMDYTYDILHGWLTGISSGGGFSEQLERETATYPQYSGNIGSMEWCNTANGEHHKYDYIYDSIGRLTDSEYSSSGSGASGRFDECLTYNSNGSITTLTRNGMTNEGTYGLIDNLTISYDGNRLKKVTDNAPLLNYYGALDFNDGANADTEYEYNANGALTKDLNRKISSITYDYSNNPKRIYLSTRAEIKYDYASDGRKLYNMYRQGSLPSTEELYIDGLTLRGGVPLMWQFDGGYVSLDSNGAPTSWNYYITDHLGSTRMVVDSNNSVKETVNYYPFGSEMTMTPPNQITPNSNWQPFRFTGKELMRQNSLNIYDFGARFFDVAGVPMWTSIDPLAEKYYHLTPYMYCAGNPVQYMDPNGELMVEYDENGRIISNLGGKSLDFRHLKNGSVRVTNKKNNKSVTINNGSKYIKDFTHRTSSVTWYKITKEFLTDSGPVNSLFSDFNTNNTGEGVFHSLRSYRSIYGLAGRSSFDSTKEKGFEPVNTLFANPLSAGLDMWEQMIGEAGVSWYNLGDIVLFMLIDSKSRTSLFYHIPFVNNYERGSGNKLGTTNQVYLWTESVDEINEKLNEFIMYLNSISQMK